MLRSVLAASQSLGWWEGSNGRTYGLSLPLFLNFFVRTREPKEHLGRPWISDASNLLLIAWQELGAPMWVRQAVWLVLGRGAFQGRAQQDLSRIVRIIEDGKRKP
jgi:hypothetical protein